MVRGGSRAVLSLLLVLAGAAHAAPRLAGQDADVSALTVSGLSSGGYMAVQFHVAHSASVEGAGVLAAGPYYCAGGRLWTAYYNCMTPRAWTPLPSQARLEAATAWLEQTGRIDPTRNLGTAKVWIFSGTRDDTVSPDVVSALATWYRRYVNPANVIFVQDRPTGHAMPSADPDVKAVCEATESPYLNRCVDKGTGKPYDAAGALLTHLMGSVPAVGATETGALKQFDQREFAGGEPYSISLAETGYVYMPAACATRRCRVHVAFHGCRQHEGAVGPAFARDAGYNRWADAHRLIVLYPQTIARPGWSFGGGFLYNPRGCWDWWGYTGAEYHTKAAPQIRAVKAMVERLGQPK
jgi:poly(3-hydroxybutyrate) depolymerase